MDTLKVRLKYTIEKATMDDVDDLSQQIFDLVLETEAVTLNLNDLRQSIIYINSNDRLGAYYKVLAEGSQTSLGSFMITWEWNLYQDKPDMWLSSVYVKPEYRKRGVFRFIFEHIQKEAFMIDTRIKLIVDDQNEAAIQSYVSMGMERYRDTVFQNDLSWNPFKGELRSNPEFSSTIAKLGDFERVVKFLSDSVTLIQNDPKNYGINPNQILNHLNQTSKEGSILLIETNGEILMSVAYFTEFSDWRNALNLAIYDVRISEKINKLPIVIELLEHAFLTFNKIDIGKPIGCYRIIFDPIQFSSFKSLLETIGIHESHYYLYGLEKK